MAGGVLEALAAEIAVCRKCDLWRARTRTVPGEGPESARVMFIGEGPGYHEDQQGRPFVGAAGMFLNELLAHAGLRREDVFIGNLLKCRPPDNRDPKPEEIAACRDYLVGQIAAISPEIICTLGRFAAHELIDRKLSITKEHGQPRRISGVLYVPLYHPAAALHREDLKAPCIEDFQRLRALLGTEQAPA